MSGSPTPATPARGARAPWLTRAFVIVAAGAAGVAAWALGLPGHRALENWFYPVRWRDLDAPPAALALGAAVPVLAWAVVRSARARRHALALALLVATSLAAQASSLLLVGPHLRTAVERFEGGHGDFLRAAHDTRERPFVEVLRAYAEDAERGRLGPFAPSKPPGTFAFYRAIYELAESPVVRAAVAPVRRYTETSPRLRAYPDAAAAGVVLFPLVTALVTLPLVWLGRALSGRTMPGYWAALLWATCPAVVVITHHTDGAWYPLLVVTSCAAAAAGTRADRPILGVLGGLALALGLWSSYGLLPALGFAVGAQLAVVVERESRAPVPRAARHVAAFVGGLALGLAVLVGSGIFPEPLASYASAMDYHHRWKNGLVGGFWGITGAYEFWAWVGVPLLALFLVALGAALGRLRSPAGRASALFAGIVLGVHLTVMLYAGCNESARLWLFEIPMFATVVAIDLWRCSARARRGGLLALALLAHLVLIPVTRAAQVW